MVPDRIVVATDGSPSALVAEGFAADLASRLGNTDVVCVTVIRPREAASVPGGSGPATPEEVTEAEQLLVDALARIQARLTNPTATARTRLVEAESPAAGIVDEAHVDGASCLIVLGTRGLGGFASVMLGSVSTQVLQVAHCPVLVVRE
jgi:nucleotide-binding universal stress UspA family protein